MDDWKELPYTENAVLLTTDQELSQDVVVKEREPNNLVDNNAFDVVPFEKQATVSSCWIITEKYKDN